MVNKILSTSLVTGFVTWLKTNFNYFDEANTQKYYVLPDNIIEGAIVDQPTMQMPAISVWLTKDNTNSSKWAEQGTLHLDVMFNTLNERSLLSKQLNEVLSAIRAQVLNNVNYIMVYLQDYSPGLLQLALTTETDMNKYREQLATTRSSTYTHSFKLNYSINIYLNQKALWAEGYDYRSPYKKIWLQNQGITPTININSN